jgi:uncharacterized protein YkwD
MIRTLLSDLLVRAETMNNRTIVAKMPRIAALCLGPLLAGLTLALLAGPISAHAAAGTAPPQTALRSSAVSTTTVFLPFIVWTTSPEYELIDLINAERVARGSSPLRVNPILMQAAEAHSQDMVDRNFFSHTNPDGQLPWDRLDEAGYAWSWCGENIGGGYTTAQAMFSGWMASDGHRDNILSSHYTEIGIGYVTGGYYGYYWTADFATPQ